MALIPRIDIAVKDAIIQATFNETNFEADDMQGHDHSESASLPPKSD